MKDLTQGSVTRTLLTLAVPIILTNLLHTAYQLIDTLWVGRLGQEAVAAVSLSFPVIFLMISLGAGFSIAGTILVAQYKGGKNEEQVQHVSAQTIVIMAIVSIFIAIIGYNLAEPIMRLMGAAPEVLPDAVSYLKVSFIGMIFLYAFFVFQSLMRGVGQVNMPMKIVFVTVILNAILNPIFIMGFGPIPAYGVTGAAITTIATQAIATIIGFYMLFKGQHGIKLSLKGFRFDRPLMKKMFFLGLPSSIEQSTKALGFAIVSFLVAGFGTLTLAAYGIGVRILTFVIIPAFGLSMATSTLVGQNMGAGKPERAAQIGKKAAQIGFISLLLIGAIVFLLATPLATAFIKDSPEVVAKATTYIQFLSATFAFLGLQLTLSGVFMGSGNTTVSMILSILALWLFELPLAYILSQHTSLGETGLWLAAPIAAVLTTTLSLIYFRSGRWQKTRLIQTKEEKLEDAVHQEILIEEGTR